MTASAVVAANAAATDTLPIAALIGFAGTILGACVAQAVAIFLARRGAQREARREAVRHLFEMAGSHVANVTFDKYVEFCERYVRDWGDALATLIEKGPCKEAFRHWQQIVRTRQQWILWVPPEIEKLLNTYEDTLLEIGTQSGLYEAIKDRPTENFGEVVDLMYRRFAELAGISKWAGQDVDANLKAKRMMEILRSQLGTDSYHLMRANTVRLALRYLEEIEIQNQE